MRVRPPSKRTALLVLALVAAVLAVVYVARDEEHLTLDDAARQAAPGSFVRLPEGMVHYELAGPASATRTLVLVHGFSVPYFVWDPTFDALVAQGFRVLRYDLYGRGWSDRPAGTYDGDLYDRQLVALLDALGIHDPVDVAGLSMGGPIAVRFAERHRPRVRTLTLIDPAYHFDDRRLSRWLRLPLVGEYMMDVVVAPSMADSQLGDFEHPDGRGAYVDQYRVQMRYGGFRRAILSTLRAAEKEPDVRDAFARVGATDLPVLLFWGKDDQTVPFAVSEEVRAAMPHAEFHAVEGAGHVPQYEKPEVVAPAMAAFVRAHER